MPEDHECLQVGTAMIGLELNAPIYLTWADLRRHLYVVGKTGTGKSTLLYNLMRADLEAGRGFALLDPHGDLATAVADATPAWRIERGVIYLDPSDLSHPVGFDPLNGIAADRRPLVAAHMVAASSTSGARRGDRGWNTSSPTLCAFSWTRRARPSSGSPGSLPTMRTATA
ncbi:MAG: DUF87 domain-containing protein [Hyphomicrobiaceae bacterium]